MLSRSPVRKVRVGPPRRGLSLDTPYLAWIRKQPCVCCGTRAYVEAAHVGPRGLGQKCPDSQTLPICRAHHWEGPESHHVMGKRFFVYWKLDRYALIARFNERYAKEKAA